MPSNSLCGEGKGLPAPKGDGKGKRQDDENHNEDADPRDDSGALVGGRKGKGKGTPPPPPPKSAAPLLDGKGYHGEMPSPSLAPNSVNAGLSLTEQIARKKQSLHCVETESLPDSMVVVAVTTMSGDRAEFDIHQHSQIAVLKKQACDHFGYRYDFACLSDGDGKVDETTILGHAISRLSEETVFQLVNLLGIKIRRRVWMVPTFGLKGGGKGRPDRFDVDDIVELPPTETLMHHRHLIVSNFVTNSTGIFIIPKDRQAEDQNASRSVLCDPPRPCITSNDKFEYFSQSAPEVVFADGSREIVLFIPEERPAKGAQ